MSMRKRIIGLVAATAFTASLVACGGGTTPAPEKKATPAATPAPVRAATPAPTPAVTPAATPAPAK